jgi:hypothetical protein
MSPPTAAAAPDDIDAEYFRPRRPAYDDDEKTYFERETPPIDDADNDHHNAVVDVTHKRLWLGFCGFVVVLLIALLLGGGNSSSPRVHDHDDHDDEHDTPIHFHHHDEEDLHSHEHSHEDDHSLYAHAHLHSHEVSDAQGSSENTLDIHEHVTELLPPSPPQVDDADEQRVHTDEQLKPEKANIL